MACLQYKKGDVKKRVQEVCKNIYYWRCFIVSSAFHQSCGLITVQVSNVEYTPGLSFTVQNKSFRYPQKCVWVSEWVCALWDGILQSTYTHTVLRVIGSQSKEEAVSHFSHQQSIVLKKQNRGRLRNISHYGRGCTLNDNVQVLSRECEGVIATFLVDRPLMSDAVIYSSIT